MATQPLVATAIEATGGSRSRSVAVSSTVLVPVGLALLTLLTRLPLGGRYLFNWDALQFALGVQRFDLAAHRPHPPGYIGYILLGRLGGMVAGGDVNTALVLLSAAAEALTVVGIYLVARRLLGEFAGLAAALLLLTSPLYWFYGETALTYGLEPGLSLAGFWLAWRAVDRGRGLAAAAVAVAAAGALRPSSEVFMLPMLLVAAWLILRRHGPRARREVAVASLALVATTAAWLAPLLWLSGGAEAYLRASLQLGSRVSGGSAVWSAGLGGLRLNVAAVLAGAADALGVFVAMALAAVVVSRLGPTRAAAARARWPVEGRLVILVAAWALPALAVYSLVHIGQLAYVLFALPAALLLAGPVLDRLAAVVSDGRERLRNRARGGLLAACVLANAVAFLAPHALASETRDRDVHVQALLAEVRRHDPARTLLLADPEGPGSYRLAQYYLPGYAAVAVGRDSHGRAGEMFADHGGAPEYDLARFSESGPLRLPAMTQALVIDQRVVDSVADRSRLHEVKLGPGAEGSVYTVDVDPADPPVAWRDGLFLRGSDCPCQGWAPPPPRPLMAPL